MPRERGVTAEHNFSNGLVTEFNSLAFPPNAVIDTMNCVFDEQGAVSRRPSIDFEDNYTTKTIARGDSVITSYKWKNVSGDGSITLHVLQVGSTLYFYRYVAGAISPGALSTTVNLLDFDPAGAPSPSLNECEFSTGLGFLFVTHPTLEPFYVSFNTATEVVTATQITVKIRDHTGIPDSTAIDTRPNALTTTHDYNLRNQGWFTTSRITSFEATVTDYPSDCDVWWLYKDVDGVFDTTLIAHTERGTTAAPKGHYILSAFNQDRATASGVVGATSTTTSFYRPTVSAFYAGRVFYAGVNYSGWESKILFSQVVEAIGQAGNCYMFNDPTSETLFEPRATDGGFFTIPDAGTIHNLVIVGQYLLVFAANGVWAVSGSDAVGFTATDFRVDRLSDTGTLNARSFIDIRGFPMFWTSEGIYAVTASQTGLKVQNITDQKIRSLFSDIPLQSKLYARGTFDTIENVAYWIYKSAEAGDLDSIYEFDRLLTYNTVSGAFAPWAIDDETVKIHDIFLTGDIRSIAVESDVVDNLGATVTIAGPEDVTVIETATSIDGIAIKFIVSYDDGANKFTIAGKNSSRSSYHDWAAIDEANYDSFYTTGYRLKTQGLRRASSPYINIYLDVTEEDTSCQLQALWDFANVDGARWSSPQTVTGTVGQYNTARRRKLIRGQGMAVQFKVSSVEGEAFNIEGWSIYDTATGSI